jgi:hypothetical protein
LATRRVTMREAAGILGVSKEAVRKRVLRGTLRSDMGEDGRRYVYIEAGGDNAADEAPTHERDALISEMVEGLRDEVHYLRKQFNQELERRSAEAERYQRIVAALAAANASLTERLQALEAAPDERESPETVEEELDRAEPRPTTVESQEGRESSEMHMPEAGGGPLPHDQQTPSERPWWRRVFGG